MGNIIKNMARAETGGCIKAIESMTGKCVYGIEIDEDETEIEIYRQCYPILPYTNYVKDMIVLRDSAIALYQKRDNWYGTGDEFLGEITLSHEEFNEIITIVKELRRYIRSHDYDNMRRAFEKAAEYIASIIQRREKELDEAFSQLFEKMVELSILDEKIQALKSDEAKEQVKECLLECLQ